MHHLQSARGRIVALRRFALVAVVALVALRRFALVVRRSVHRWLGEEAMLGERPVRPAPDAASDHDEETVQEPAQRHPG
jgi:hypothetical protein